MGDQLEGGQAFVDIKMKTLAYRFKQWKVTLAGGAIAP